MNKQLSCVNNYLCVRTCVSYHYRLRDCSVLYFRDGQDQRIYFNFVQ